MVIEIDWVAERWDANSLGASSGFLAHGAAPRECPVTGVDQPTGWGDQVAQTVVAVRPWGPAAVGLRVLD
jgi:hypothetical protein